MLKYSFRKDTRSNKKRGTIGSKLLKKILLISEFAPPQVNGPATVLKSILTFFPSGSYAIFMDQKSYGFVDENDRLPCKYFNYNIKTKGPKFLREFMIFLNIPFIIYIKNGLW